MKTNYKIEIHTSDNIETKYITDNTKAVDADNLMDLINEALDNGAELVSVYDNDNGEFLGEWEQNK